MPGAVVVEEHAGAAEYNAFFRDEVRHEAIRLLAELACPSCQRRVLAADVGQLQLFEAHRRLSVWVIGCERPSADRALGQGPGVSHRSERPPSTTCSSSTRLRPGEPVRRGSRKRRRRCSSPASGVSRKAPAYHARRSGDSVKRLLAHGLMREAGIVVNGDGVWTKKYEVAPYLGVAHPERIVRESDAHFDGRDAHLGANDAHPGRAQSSASKAVPLNSESSDEELNTEHVEGNPWCRCPDRWKHEEQEPHRERQDPNQPSQPTSPSRQRRSPLNGDTPTIEATRDEVIVLYVFAVEQGDPRPRRAVGLDAPSVERSGGTR